MSQRRVGRVVSIRLSPQDCMAVVDAAKKMGVRMQQVSFPQLVSLALSAALESFRQNGIIPERDGFEYSEMMAQFPDGREIRRGFARALTADTPETREMKNARIRLDELLLKAEADPLNMTQELKDEMEQLTKLLRGKGTV